MHFNPVLHEETSLTIIFIVKKQFNKLRQKGNQSPIGSNRATLLQKPSPQISLKPYTGLSLALKLAYLTREHLVSTL